jgi:DNA polymerase-3 subunit epsilon
MSRFAVIDIETTGLSPAHNHRVVEVAVVLVDDDGTSVWEWETLVNPQRDVAAGDIHGLTARTLYSAPTFEQVSGELASILRGRVPVAHNLAFDAPFLASEYERLGAVVPLEPTTGLCTMRLAGRYLHGGPRSLSACCQCADCAHESAHNALGDARATARLLARYMQLDGDFVATWSDPIARAQTSPWPALSVTDCPHVTREQAASMSSEHFLARLASRMPRSELHPEANSYLALLDRVLLDREVSLHEADELVSVAAMMGISREDACSLHRAYLAALGRLAAEDGVVTDEERHDLLLVARLLGLETDEVDEALANEAMPASTVCDVGGFRLGPGDRIVFTGECPGVDREDLVYQAQALGLRVTSAVSGKTKLLVAADPDSLSGKARRARELAVPIVGYQSYAAMLESVGGRGPAQHARQPDAPGARSRVERDGGAQVTH